MIKIVKHKFFCIPKVTSYIEGYEILCSYFMGYIGFEKYYFMRLGSNRSFNIVKKD